MRKLGIPVVMIESWDIASTWYARRYSTRSSRIPASGSAEATHHDKPDFATMQKVAHLSREEISQVLNDRLDDGVVSRSDGWRAYGVLKTGNRTHQLVIVGTAGNEVKVLPWVNTVANVKGTIRGAYHGVRSKHLSRYLSKFCYRFN
jgi:hypothetical protein